MNKLYFTQKYLNESEVSFLRKRFTENLELEKINNIEDLLKYDEGRVIFNEKFLDLIKKNLDIKDFIFLNLAKIQKRKSYLDKNNGGWHKDFGSFDDQLKILSKKKNYIYKIGIYLQKNKKNFGGGIDMLKTVFFDNLKINNKLISFLRRIYYFFLIRFFDNMVKTDKGDMAGFSGLVYHRTSPRKISTDEINVETKYSIYFLLTNLETIQDAIKAYDNKFNTNKLNYLNENIKAKNLNHLQIQLLSREYSRFLEKVLGETHS